jgi:hypothetical protein
VLSALSTLDKSHPLLSVSTLYTLPARSSLSSYLSFRMDCPGITVLLFYLTMAPSTRTVLETLYQTGHETGGLMTLLICGSIAGHVGKNTVYIVQYSGLPWGSWNLSPRDKGRLQNRPGQSHYVTSPGQAGWVSYLVPLVSWEVLSPRPFLSLKRPEALGLPWLSPGPFLPQGRPGRR